MLSITSPKDGRTLRIFRCECGKLTSAVNRHSRQWSRQRLTIDASPDRAGLWQCCIRAYAQKTAARGNQNRRDRFDPRGSLARHLGYPWPRTIHPHVPLPWSATAGVLPRYQSNFKSGTSTAWLLAKPWVLHFRPETKPPPMSYPLCPKADRPPALWEISPTSMLR